MLVMSLVGVLLGFGLGVVFVGGLSLVVVDEAGVVGPGMPVMSV